MKHLAIIATGLLAATTTWAAPQIVEVEASEFVASSVLESIGSTSASPLVQKQRVDFGWVEVHTTEYRYLTFENNGEEDLTNVTLGLRGDSAFGGATNCEDVLPAGTSCDIRLDFRPWHIGSFWGTLVADSDQFNAEVDLWGYGEDRR